MAKIYCNVPSIYKGFRELEFFKREVSEAWSKTGQVFPMYDKDSGEIFECAFNPESGLIVAYAEVSVSEFRSKMQEEAKRLIEADFFEAMVKAHAKAFSLVQESLFFVE